MASSNLQDLGQGGQESIHALIQAMAPDIARSSGGNLTTEEVARRLNDKLAEMVGPEALSSDIEKRNERGELINEEGLPIVEISETVDPTDLRTNVSLPTPVTVEPLLPLASLTDDVRARLRAKRDQILDRLEQEESQAEIAQRRREMEEREALSRKTKEDGVKDKERLREARELQKKMGRALLLNVSKAREKERQEQAAQRLRDEEADQDRKRSPTMKKKTVAFAERTEQIDRSETDPESASSTDWGDVTPGRLTERKRPTLLSQALLDRHPMKFSVVERMPSKPTQSTRPGADSDDDSETEYPPDSSDNEEDEPSLETDDIDFDTAQHQRDIALEYHAKRNTIGKEAAQALMMPSGAENQHEAQDLSQESAKPAISHFKASRLASAYMSEPSNSLAATVVPASSARTLQRSIRTGKLDSDGHLVGGEDDSASEDEADGLQSMLELIQQGEIYNVGSNGEYIPNPKHNEVPQSSQPAASSSVQAGISLPFQANKLPAPSMRSKTSKFKVSRTAAGRPSPGSLSLPVNDTPTSSASTTPISYENRSSPKLDTPTTPVMTPTVGERTRPATGPSASATGHDLHSPQPTSAAANQEPPGSLFPMTIDSPSFPAHGPHTIPTVVLESPYPQNTSRLVRPPIVLSSKTLESRGPTTRPGLQSPKPLNSLSFVRESCPTYPAMQSSDHEQDRKKVSRFKTERGS